MDFTDNLDIFAYKDFVKAVKKYSTGTEIDIVSFTVAVNGTTKIPHGLAYNSSTDDLLVFCDGILLHETSNYTINADKSISLVGWSIDIGSVVDFKLYKYVK